MARLSIFASVLLLIACVPPLRGGDATRPGKELSAHDWQLSEARDAQGKRIDELFARPAHPLTLNFDDGYISVRNSCNSIGGAYRVKEDRLILDDLVQTLAACLDPAMAALDPAITRRIQPSVAFRLRSTPPTLTLITTDSDVLTFAGVTKKGRP